MPRKHRSTGNQRGGPRLGAGRKPGSTNALELGEVRGIKAAGLRVPETASKAERELADRAQQRIIDVMEEGVSYLAASAVLKAAAHIREEICGAVKQKIEHSGLDGLTDEQLQARLDALLAAKLPAEPEGDA